MVVHPKAQWQQYLDSKLQLLLTKRPIPFSDTRALPRKKRAGVYLITAAVGDKEYPYYVGTTKDMTQRIYTNHLMGSFTNARLKKYLVEFGQCKDIADAKTFIRRRCSVRWIPIKAYRMRGLVEAYITGKLKPKYGISEEH